MAHEGPEVNVPDPEIVKDQVASAVNDLRTTLREFVAVEQYETELLKQEDPAPSNEK